MKKRKKIILIPTILLPIVIILNIYCSIPSQIVVTRGSDCSINISNLCNTAKNDTITVSSGTSALSEENSTSIKLNTSSCGSYNIPVKLLNVIPLKTIDVTVAPEKFVFPSGDTIGIKMYTDGLPVVAVTDFTSASGETVSPAKRSGLQKGDIIMSVNGNRINTAEDLSSYLTVSAAELQLSIKRGEEFFNTSIIAEPEFASGKPRLGMWVRDSTAGIGTLTYIVPETNEFASLGHAICDSDTGEIMSLRKGNVLSCEIMSVVKGSYGNPGELVGSFGGKTYGTIKQNSELGIYGTLDNTSEINHSEPLPTATRFQIKEGDAEILSNVDGNGVKAYSVQITKISKNRKVDNKGIVLKITDEELISKTGGIVQGMSGSPIIQNGKLVGAVTHVFVNDPTRGYGVFIENMLSEGGKDQVTSG